MNEALIRELVGNWQRGLLSAETAMPAIADALGLRDYGKPHHYRSKPGWHSAYAFNLSAPSPCRHCGQGPQARIHWV